jgi:hypothetical protein
MAKMNLLKGIASLFKRKSKDVAEGVVKPEKVFAQNLIDEFGDVEVREAYRIIDDRTPELEKLFYREGESKLDDLVNLLESRYMSSNRLQAHPLSFNRRGPGAADRYMKINETGERLTDMPGGPGDRVLYFKHYGEMSDTVIQGKKVYDTPPSILEEGTRITDTGTTIEGKAIQDSLYEKTIADMPLINRMMKETGKTETEIREAIADIANQGYEAGSPKRMSPFDDDSMRAFVSNRETIPGDKEDFVTDMMERLGEGRTASVKKTVDDMITGMTDESDAILKNMKKMEAEAKAMSEISMAEQQEIGSAIDTFNRMMDAGDDPAEALQFLQAALKKTRTKQADGGRVEMALGGAAKGIMEAIKLAARGVKPFGQKQTYKQNVKNMGLSNFDQVEVVTSKQIDELRNANDVDGLFEMLEDVVSGKKFGMANPAQRKVLQENIEEALNDIPLNRDSRERLSEDYFNMMEYYKPDPKETGKVIPFKPREKKFKGGIAGLLKRIMSPKLEKEMVETGPFQTGHRSDIVGDMEQIKNVSRNEGVTLERLDSLYDMVQQSPRYNEAMRGAMMKLVDYERFRAILLDDNVKLQRMIDMDPEGSEEFIRMLFREGGSEPQFNLGGLVPPQKGPMSEGMGTLYRRK